MLLLLLNSPDVDRWEQAVQRNPTAANYRNLASAYEKSEQFSKASSAYEKASERYGKLGDPNAAKVLMDLSLRYKTSISLFVERPATRAANDLARLEPTTGCYLGANVERDDVTRDPAEFGAEIGKAHALFFIYRSYGMPFPSELANELKRQGSGLQIAFEPGDLSEVHDDAYLQGFARDAARSGIPVFLRFASEMNGDWTPYHSSPSLYIEKFRLVARVTRDIAPNLAMVWCPNVMPEPQIDQYWPGDDAVDWVGVNFYSVLFNDGDRSKGAAWRHPADSLDYIYRKYTPLHPMMVGEWAASHLSVVDNIERPDFAIDKIGQFYAAVPRLYPRVKAIHWLSMNTIKHAEGPRKLNNFCLLDDKTVAASYGNAVGSAYYLSQVRHYSPVSYQAVSDREVVTRGETLSAVIRSYDQRPRVRYRIAGLTYTMDRQPSAYELPLPKDLPTGPTNLEIEVTDEHGRPALTQTVKLIIQ